MATVENVQADGYVVIQGVRSRYGSQDVIEAKVRRVTQARPSLGTDEIAVKLKIRVPAAAFGPFTASAVVDVPDELISKREVEVTAEEVDD